MRISSENVTPKAELNYMTVTSLDAQELVDVASDSRQSPQLRSASMEVLNAGACEIVHLRTEDIETSLSRAAYLIVLNQIRCGQRAPAVKSLALFGGLSSTDSERLVDGMIAASQWADHGVGDARLVKMTEDVNK